MDEETAGRLKELKELEQEITKQRREEKCKCGPWKYSRVGAALKDLSEREQDLSWAYETWLWASMVMHHSIPLVPAPDEPAELPTPDFQERGIQLLRFIHLLVNFGIILLELERPAKANEWRDLATALVRQEGFTDSVQGLFDKAHP